MKAVPTDTSATKGQIILLILHFLLWNAGSIQWGLILTVIPGLIHSTYAYYSSSPQFCFFSSQQSFQMLFIFFMQIGISSFASLSSYSTVQSADLLLSVLNPEILNSNFQGMTRWRPSSYKRTKCSLSYFYLFVQYYLYLYILVASDFYNCSFSLYLSAQSFSFLVASMKSLVLFTMQTTLQLGGLPITCKFFTFCKYAPNSVKFFHWV